MSRTDKIKKKKLPRLSMRFRLVLVVVVEYGIISMLAWALTRLLHYFGIDVYIPDFVSYLVMGALLGSAITGFLTQWIFAPITRLRRAMDDVAAGNFSARLDEEHKFPEIRDLYHNFNLMTKELGATEILQTDFVSNVSHEFKTPINAIEGYATLLQGGGDLTAEEQEQYVEKILFNTRRLSSLVGNILLLSKVDNQVIQSQKSSFRLDEQIRQSLLMLESAWTEKELEFEVDLQPMRYVGYENLLMHVWNNLLGNAVKFTPPGGLIRLQLQREGRKVIFTVEDSGPGIPEEAQKHIFDKFYQSDSSHKQEGNGLGLALVKQITEISGGTVTVENIPEGGCRFTVTLPL